MHPLLLWLGAMACASGRVPDCGESGAERSLPGGRPGSRATYGIINGYEVVLYSGEPEREGGACNVKTGRFITGPAGFSVAAAGVDDPVQLAQLSMALLERGVAGQSPWTGAADGPPPEVAPTPPALRDGTLTYWRRHTQTADWVFVTVKLDTGAVTEITDRQLLDSRVGATDRLRAGLADPDALVRATWMGKAIEIGSPEAMALFTEAARNDPSPLVRKEAVSRLGNLKPPGAADLLAEHLAHDPSPEVRALAATMLGRVGGAGARAALEAAAKADSDPTVRASAEGALARMASP